LRKLKSETFRMIQLQYDARVKKKCTGTVILIIIQGLLLRTHLFITYAQNDKILKPPAPHTLNITKIEKTDGVPTSPCSHIINGRLS